MNTVILGSDHRGFELKRMIQILLLEEGVNAVDRGCWSPDESVDYPHYANAVAREIAEPARSVDDYDVRGVLVCGSGFGVAIAANKVPGIRAVTCRSNNDAAWARKHNDANIVCIGADVTALTLGISIVKTFMTTDFEGGRHQRRVNMIEG